MLMRGTWVGCWDGETKGENGEEGEIEGKEKRGGRVREKRF